MTATLQLELVMRLALAALRGALVGMERERLDRAAGLRTHALVSLGSAGVMLVSAYGFHRLNDSSYDPSRMAAQVVSGIGFLGAGTIILRREVVRGLTTAASMWVAAAIGLAVGAGLYVVAPALTLLTLLVLIGLKPLEVKLFQRNRSRELRVAIDRQPGSIKELQRLLRAGGISADQVELRRVDGTEWVKVDITGIAPETVTAAVETLRAHPTAHRVEVIGGKDLVYAAELEP
ncbi:MAG: MgtC/SapB family protein [Candidatus Dormibacteria bacterium]